MPIAKVVISDFRGITKPVEIDFRYGPSNNPCSMIIVGDNGTGKSSIVDAIEFALQGRVGRKKVPLFSFASSSITKVKVVFSDGTETTREIDIVDGKRIQSDTKPHPKYSIASFVLRRSDLLRFIESPDRERQVIFLQYFRGAITRVNEITEFQQDELDELETLLESKLRTKLRLMAKLARYAGASADNFPTDPELFEQFINARLSKEQIRKAAKQGQKLLHPIAYDALQRYRKVSREIPQIKKQIKNIARRFVQTDTSEIQNIFANVGDRLTEAFRSISQ